MNAQDQLRLHMVQGNLNYNPAGTTKTFAIDSVLYINYQMPSRTSAGVGWFCFNDRQFSMVEISNVSVGNVYNGQLADVPNLGPMIRTFQASAALRFEYGTTLTKTDSRCKFLVSAAVRPFFNHASTTSYVSNIFPTRFTQIGISGELIPRLLLRLSPRFLLDLNAPFALITADYSRFNFASPAIQPGSQTSELFEFSTNIDRIGVRLGIAFQI
jgi:hypothetical protein